MHNKFFIHFFFLLVVQCSLWWFTLPFGEIRVSLNVFKYLDLSSEVGWPAIHRAARQVWLLGKFPPGMTGIPANRAGSVVIKSQSWVSLRLTKVPRSLAIKRTSQAHVIIRPLVLKPDFTPSPLDLTDISHTHTHTHTLICVSVGRQNRKEAWNTKAFFFSSLSPLSSRKAQASKKHQRLENAFSGHVICYFPSSGRLLRPISVPLSETFYLGFTTQWNVFPFSQ